MLSGMNWEEELDLLTKFHENNLGPANVKSGDDDDDKIINKSVVVDAHALVEMQPGKGGKVMSIGRGRKISAQDDSFIAKQIEKTMGTAHRAESIFSSKTSSKSDYDASLDKQSPLKASTPSKEEGQRITTKPKLVHDMGRGRGRKAHTATEEFPVGVVANMIEKNIGRGHRAVFAHNNINNNNNNNFLGL